jgi:hypothetical protein
MKRNATVPPRVGGEISVWEFNLIGPKRQWLLLTRKESAVLGNRAVPLERTALDSSINGE